MSAPPLRITRKGVSSAVRNLGRIPLTAKISLLIIAAYGVVALLAPWLAPFGEAEIIGRPYQQPGSGSLLGTDQLGRDLLSRMIYGARNTIGIALFTAILSFLIGVPLGLFCAVKQGLFDEATGRVVDALMSIPTLVFSLMLLAVVGKNPVNLILILAMLDSTRAFRLSRALGMSVVTMEFYEAAKLRGQTSVSLALREILPNIRHPLISEFGLRFCFVFLTISALSFLGVGLQPPTADWGSMVAENKVLISYGRLAPIFPALAIAVLMVSVNFVVDWYTSEFLGGRSDRA